MEGDVYIMGYITGKMIKELREKKKITQVRLSIAAEVSQETISAYESGKAFPSVETLIKIADFLGTSTDYLLDRIKDFQIITIHCVDCVRLPKYSEKQYPYIMPYKCETYDECDRTMTEYSDFDIAWIRPGREDSHTAMNIKRRYYGKV